MQSTITFVSIDQCKEKTAKYGAYYSYGLFPTLVTVIYPQTLLNAKYKIKKQAAKVYDIFTDP